MKELKDYIHLYIGCNITYPDIESEAPMVIARLTGISNQNGVETTYLEVQKNDNGTETHGDYLSWKPNGHHKSDALHIKLILRPLDEMSDAESTVYAQLGDADFNKAVGRKDYYAVDKMAAHQVFWALKKGFDLFDLHAAGLAVHENELPK
jgi:hypothetical protein